MRKKPEKEACSLECISESAPSAWPAMCVCRKTETDRQVKRLKEPEKDQGTFTREALAEICMEMFVWL